MKLTQAAHRIVRCCPILLLFALSSAFAAENVQTAKQPIYVPYFTHQEDTFIRDVHKGAEAVETPWMRGPKQYAERAKNIIESWRKNGIKGEYATIGAALQQLNDECPELIGQIKQMQLPITHYDGSGHIEPAAVGRVKNLAGMTLDEALCALWNAETRTLVPNWHFEDGNVVLGNPRAGEPITFDELPEYNIPQKKTWLFGGILAVEKLLGIIPLDFFQAQFKNLGRNEAATVNPITAVKRALGMGSYEVSVHAGNPSRIGLPAEYLAANWPRDAELYAWPGMDAGGLENLLARPDAFRIIGPDPAGYQWQPKNSALAFLQKTYGVSSIDDMLAMACPVAQIKNLMTPEEKENLLKVIRRLDDNRRQEKEQGYANWQRRLITAAEAKSWPGYLMGVWEDRREMPPHLRLRERRLTKDTIAEAAKYLLLHWPRPNHDGDFGGPPDFVQAGADNLSLAETFVAFAFVLEHYAVKEQIPDEVTVKDIIGPIDYPVYELEKEPKLDAEKAAAVAGWQPYELDRKYFPDPKIVLRQGLASESFFPFSADVNEVSIMQAAAEAAQFIRKNGHVPGSIEIFIPSSTNKDGKRAKDELLFANAAELLYGMAQVTHKLYANKLPGAAKMVSVKIIPDQICRYVVNSSPIHYLGGRFQADWLNRGFIWRAWVPVSLLNSSWTCRD